jgi:hypothetical protein
VLLGIGLERRVNDVRHVCMVRQGEKVGGGPDADVGRCPL